MKAILLFSGLVMGNFIFQFMGDHAYQVACERSFFQGMALLLYCFVDFFSLKD